MKKWVMVLFGFCIVYGALAQGPGFRLEPIGSAVIPVTLDKMTNLIFPEAVQAGVKVSTAVIAQKVRGVENVIELKALRRDFAPTNLSVYGRDGRLYSFVLRYVADDSVLNFRVVPAGKGTVMLTGLPAGVEELRRTASDLESKRAYLHASAKVEDVKVRLCGVYNRDSLVWLVIRVRNRSGVDFVVSGVRYTIEERKKLARRAVQEVEMTPVYSDVLSSVGAGGVVSFAAGFEPFFVEKGRRLVVEVRGRDGRVVRVRVGRVRPSAE